ncbi:hypothetical protein COCVIDRAFT_16457 [Bipolaris victoriae FI3]|uniref:Uncharacterized protein n=1 Tax=Bipolaris victoriae (strain FI3) TaxID=930091 RepID=W7E7I3_BIPV3|nr:hypothetical protein COCVIDRAFT_16457 [Bipolaris victoriae FI3]
MSRPTTPIPRSRPSTSQWAHHHTSPSRESNVKHTSPPSSHHEETPSESCPKPPSPHASRQPSQERPRSPTPNIMLSGWQPVEPSPALWVFVKNVPALPSAPEFAGPPGVPAQEQAQVGLLQTDCDGSRCDSVVEGEMVARARRNGGEMVRGVDVDIDIDVDLERQGVEEEEDKAQGIRRVWGRIRGWMLGWLS